jgi:hypothetical protein
MHLTRDITTRKRIYGYELLTCIGRKHTAHMTKEVPHV